jgi:hypothetical protein
MSAAEHEREAPRAELAPPVRQQPEGVDAARVTLVAVLGVLVMLGAAAAAALLLRAQQGSYHGPRAGAAPRVAPRELGIVDQTPVGLDRFGPATAEAQRAGAARWGYVDPARTIARIPIGEAMDLYLLRAAQRAHAGATTPVAPNSSAVESGVANSAGARPAGGAGAAR